MNSEQAELLEQMFREHYSSLQIYAFRFLENWDAAAQAVQESFHIACERIEVFADSPNRIGWLKKTVRYVCLNTIKTRNRRMKDLIALEELSAKQLPSVYDEYSIGADESFKSILSEEEYQLLYEIIVQGIPYSSVANKHGITMWACRKRVQRIIKKLRANLSSIK